MNRAARAAHGLDDMSRRRYNKLFRLTARLEGYATELDRQLELATDQRRRASLGRSARCVPTPR